MVKNFYIKEIIDPTSINTYKQKKKYLKNRYKVVLDSIISGNDCADDKYSVTDLRLILDINKDYKKHTFQVEYPDQSISSDEVKTSDVIIKSGELLIRKITKALRAMNILIKLEGQIGIINNVLDKGEVRFFDAVTRGVEDKVTTTKINKLRSNIIREELQQSDEYVKRTQTENSNNDNENHTKLITWMKCVSIYTLCRHIWHHIFNGEDFILKSRKHPSIYDALSETLGYAGINIMKHHITHDINEIPESINPNSIFLQPTMVPFDLNDIQAFALMFIDYMINDDNGHEQSHIHDGTNLWSSAPNKQTILKSLNRYLNMIREIQEKIMTYKPSYILFQKDKHNIPLIPLEKNSKNIILSLNINRDNQLRDDYEMILFDANFLDGKKQLKMYQEAFIPLYAFLSKELRNVTVDMEELKKQKYNILSKGITLTHTISKPFLKTFTINRNKYRLDEITVLNLTTREKNKLSNLSQGPVDLSNLCKEVGIFKFKIIKIRYKDDMDIISSFQESYMPADFTVVVNKACDLCGVLYVDQKKKDKCVHHVKLNDKQKIVQHNVESGPMSVTPRETIQKLCNVFSSFGQEFREHAKYVYPFTNVDIVISSLPFVVMNSLIMDILMHHIEQEPVFLSDTYKESKAHISWMIETLSSKGFNLNHNVYNLIVIYVYDLQRFFDNLGFNIDSTHLQKITVSDWVFPVSLNHQYICLLEKKYKDNHVFQNIMRNSLHFRKNHHNMNLDFTKTTLTYMVGKMPPESLNDTTTYTYYENLMLHGGFGFVRSRNMWCCCKKLGKNAEGCKISPLHDVNLPEVDDVSKIISNTSIPTYHQHTSYKPASRFKVEHILPKTYDKSYKQPYTPRLTSTSSDFHFSPSNSFYSKSASAPQNINDDEKPINHIRVLDNFTPYQKPPQTSYDNDPAFKKTIPEKLVKDILNIDPVWSVIFNQVKATLLHEQKL